MKRSLVVRALLAGSALFISTGRAGAGAARLSRTRPTRPPTRPSPRRRQLDDAQAKIELLQAQVEALQEVDRPRSRPRRPRSRRRGRARRSSRTRKPAGASRSAAASSMTSATSPIRTIAISHPQPRLQRPRPPHPPRRRRHDPGRLRLQVRDGLRQRRGRLRRLPSSATRRPTRRSTSPSATRKPTTASSRSAARAGRASSSARRSTTRSSIPAASASTLGYVNKAGDFRINAGLWTAHSIDSTLDNDGWIGAARAVYAPLMGGNQLHFGVNYQHREFQSNNGATDRSASGAAVDQPAGPLSCPAVLAADRRPLRRHRQLRRQERRHHRPGSRRHLQVAAHRGGRPVSEVERL